MKTEQLFSNPQATTKLAEKTFLLKKLKLNFCAGNPPADAQLTEKTKTELTEKNLKLNFCAGNPPADAELTEKTNY
jgi:hypothetical protein